VETSLWILGQRTHRFGAMRLYEHYHPREGVFAIMDNPFPRLTGLDLEIPDGAAVGRIDGPHPFPPLESLILHGDTTCIRGFQPSNLRKLGISCERGFQPPSLFEFFAEAQLLEELEFEVDQRSFTAPELGQDVPPVTLESLQQIVFRGTLPPHHNKITLACHPPGTRRYPDSHPFPRGTQLPIPAPSSISGIGSFMTRIA